MKIEELLSAWARWCLGDGHFSVAGTNVLYNWMHGVVSGRTCRSFVPFGVDMGSLSPDALFCEVERAVAGLPRRQREAVRVEFLSGRECTQMDKARSMQPPCSQSVYSRHLNLALNQLANSEVLSKLLN